jgi:hypothetical protein
MLLRMVCIGRALRMVGCGSCVLCRISLEFCLAASTAKQNIHAAVHHAMRRVGLRNHAADRITLRVSMGRMFIVVLMLVVHDAHAGGRAPDLT